MKILWVSSIRIFEHWYQTGNFPSVREARFSEAFVLEFGEDKGQLNGIY